MAKEQFSRTKACATKTLYAVMKEMVRRGGSIPAKEIYPWVNENVAASGSDKFLRLIDGDEFIEKWQEYYDKMTDDDKNMLPLKRISFLGSNE